MLKPAMKSLECQEKGFEIHTESDAGPAGKSTTDVQDQSSRDK